MGATTQKNLAIGKRKGIQVIPNYRSRSGCEECKRERVKCDEKKPSCSKCLSRGFKCIYKRVLHFRDEYEMKGKKFGREGVWSKRGRGNTIVDLTHGSKHSNYLSVKNADKLVFVNFFQGDIDKNCYALPEPVLAPSLFPTELIISGGHDSLNILIALEYYEKCLSPVFDPMAFKSQGVLDFSENSSDTRVLIGGGLQLSSLLQYAQYHTSVFHLLISLGSVYLSKLKGNASFFIQSQKFKGSAFNLINKKANLFGESLFSSRQLATFTTDVILSLVLLILCDLANDCNENWILYLKVAKKIMFSGSFIKPKNELEHSLLMFSLEFLHYQETMGRTACKDGNSFFLPTDDDDFRFENAVPKIITWVGCDWRLVNVISDITDLSLERVNQGTTEENYRILCEDIEYRIMLLEIKVDFDSYLIDLGEFFKSKGAISISESDLVSINSMTKIENLCFVLSSEIKRLAVYLYFKCCLLNKRPDDHDINELVTNIFRLLKFVILKHDFRWCTTLLWPLFISCSVISNTNNDSDEFRYLAMQLLDKLEFYSLGNVHKVKEIIIGIWKKRDLNLNNEKQYRNYCCPECKPTYNKYLGFTNDWETYVADASYKISLA